MIIVLLRRFSSCAAAGGTTWKKKGVCEDTSRSGRGSAPAPREILTGWGEDTSQQGLCPCTPGDTNNVVIGWCEDSLPQAGTSPWGEQHLALRQGLCPCTPGDTNRMGRKHLALPGTRPCTPGETRARGGQAGGVVWPRLFLQWRH